MAENVLDANYKTTLIHMATAWLHLADQVDIRAQSGGKRPTPEQLSNASCWQISSTLSETSRAHIGVKPNACGNFVRGSAGVYIFRSFTQSGREHIASAAFFYET